MDTTTETWMPIPDTTGYEASSLGRLRSRRKILSPVKMANGYMKAMLGRGRQGTVHAFVAMAFLGPRQRGMCVAHKNGIRDDNRIDNLQYTTFSGNNIHRRMHGTAVCPLIRAGDGRPSIFRRRANKARGSAHGMSTRTEAQAIAVHSLIAVGRLISDVATELGVPYMWVANVAAGRRWRHLHPDPMVRLS